MNTASPSVAVKKFVDATANRAASPGNDTRGGRAGRKRRNGKETRQRENYLGDEQLIPEPGDKDHGRDALGPSAAPAQRHCLDDSEGNAQHEQ